MTIDHERDMADELVCPRCGAEASDAAPFCRTCGLNLQIQDELPTAEHYAAELRSGGRTSYKGGSSKGGPKLPTAAVAIGAVALLVLAGLAIGAIVVSTQDDDPQLVNPAQISSARASAVSKKGAGPYAARSGKSGGASSTTLIEALVERHWNNIEKGQLVDAYADFSSSLRSDSDVGDEAKWVAGQKADPIQSATITVKAHDVRRRTAEVEVVKLRTVAKNSGCKRWTGTYAMVRESGRWKIDAAPLQSQAC